MNALWDALTVLLFVYLAHRLGYDWAGWTVALVWSLLPYSVTFAIGGMETGLFVLFRSYAVG